VQFLGVIAVLAAAPAALASPPAPVPGQWILPDGAAGPLRLDVTGTEHGYVVKLHDDFRGFVTPWTLNGCPGSGVIPAGSTLLDLTRRNDGTGELDATLHFRRFYITGPNGRGELPADECPYVDEEYTARFVDLATATSLWPDQVAELPAGTTSFLHLEADLTAPCPVPESATHTCLAAGFDFNPLLAAPLPDTDGDGLPDEWEANGYTRNGVHVPLNRMGADPMHKDLFVEMDAAAGAAYPVAALRALMDAFAAIPIDNPDGRKGIHLHVDAGPDTPMTTTRDWGDLSHGEPSLSLPAHFSSFPDGPCGEHLDRAPFDAVIADHFARARAAAFRYALAVRFMGPTSHCWAGEAWSIPSTDLLVADWMSVGGTETILGTMPLASLLMHELGHTLGLHHGGTDDINYKPNYPSVMNYLWNLRGVRPRDTSHSVLQYSSLVPSADTAINQDALDESAGLGDVSPGYWLGRHCPDGSDWEFAPNTPFDLDCDGRITPGVRRIDVTPDSGDVSDVQTADDSANLTFAVGSIGVAGLGSRVPEGRPEPETASAVTLLTAGRAEAGDRHAPTISARLLRRGSKRYVRVTAHDDRGISTILIVSKAGRKTVFVSGVDPVRSRTVTVVVGRRGPVSVRAIDLFARVSPLLRLSR